MMAEAAAFEGTNKKHKECQEIPSIRLTAGEELTLHQLSQVRTWQEKQCKEGNAAILSDGGQPESQREVPDRWRLTEGVKLHTWQLECINAWFANEGRGVIKVVTGAGKTLLALGIAERLQNSKAPNLKVAIIVPTVVLLAQWYEEIIQRSNLPVQAIGRMGGGYAGSFDDSVRVLICVLNSASRKLPKEVEKSNLEEDLLLVVDECHRAGSAEMRRVFGTNRSFSLGLSATPERDDEPPDDESETDESSGPPRFDDSILGQELGSVIYELTYSEAVNKKILPPFRIVHYGLSLRAREREQYENISREITDLRGELQTKTRRGLALVRWCRSKAARNNPKAARFIGLTTERKRLLYRMETRLEAVMRILRRSFEKNPRTKAILFHESIDEVMRLFEALRQESFAVVAEHSGFPDNLRAESLRLFRNGTAKVIVSARSLIEGFNVPSADIGIVVAASSSVRQRVQTLGRLLRRVISKDGTEKYATLYILYGKDTVDELIYSKSDWETFVGADRNEYFMWENVIDADPTACAGPPRRPPIDEDAVDTSTLRPGEAYPGDPDQGTLYSLDTQKTIRDEDGRLMKPHPKLTELLTKFRRAAGRFRVTPKNLFVTALERKDQSWQCVFIGQLKSPIEIASSEKLEAPSLDQLTPSDEYPIGFASGKTFSILQRDERLIAQKSGKNVRFVVPAKKLESPRESAQLCEIQQRVKQTYAAGRQISKITVTPQGHVVYVYENRAYFLGEAPLGADGFRFEDG